MTLRRYQSHSSGWSCRSTPESAASGENGTTISPSYDVGRSAVPVKACSHGPFRLTQPGLTSWGRGCSGRGRSRSSSRPQRVSTADYWVFSTSGRMSRMIFESDLGS